MDLVSFVNALGITPNACKDVTLSRQDPKVSNNLEYKLSHRISLGIVPNLFLSGAPEHKRTRVNRINHAE